MQANELRASFLGFFKERGHVVVPSVSLVPKLSTLLFTNAGMNAFVPVFLGEEEAKAPRVANAQRCLRAGGKHNDLEAVGLDSYHHTLFEMLGNWSFNDYFKEEAIQWSWELLTRVWGLPKERLYITVFDPKGDTKAPQDVPADEESYRLWASLLEKEGLRVDKQLLRFGSLDNFWSMGDTGPCGPSSEIHLDLSVEGDRGGAVNQGSASCVELWNLVFIQYQALPAVSPSDRVYEPLPRSFVDTGLGLERLAGAFACTEAFKDFSRGLDNYQSTLFSPLMEALQEASSLPYTGTFPPKGRVRSQQEQVDTALRLVADHVRAAVVAIGDGVLPDKEARGYVARRVLRRALYAGLTHLKLPSHFLLDLIAPALDCLKGAYELRSAEIQRVKNCLEKESDQFNRLLEQSQHALKKALKNGPISAGEAFKLYDTHGVPLELIEATLADQGDKLDLPGFEVLLKQQQARGRHKAGGKTLEAWTALASEEPATFQVDKKWSTPVKARVIASAYDNARGAEVVFTDQTPCYPQGGGQVGDKGLLKSQKGSFKITNTLKYPHPHFPHKSWVGHLLGESDTGTNTGTAGRAKNGGGVDGGQTGGVGDSTGTNTGARQPCEGTGGGTRQARTVAAELLGCEVSLSVAENFHAATARAHTATHLLHWALREILGTGIRQSGSLVEADALRFDFSHNAPLGQVGLREVEKRVREAIKAGAEVKTQIIPYAQKPAEAIATFGERYGQFVRLVSIGGGAFGQELCGGSHVANTAEIGTFCLLGEKGIGAGKRRVRAVCGATDARKGKEEGKGGRGDEDREAAEAIVVEKLKERVRVEGKIRCLSEVVRLEQAAGARSIALKLAKQVPDGLIVLAVEAKGQWRVLALAGKKARGEGHKAHLIVRELCESFGGKGGGKADFASGGLGQLNSEEERRLLACLRTLGT